MERLRRQPRRICGAYTFCSGVDSVPHLALLTGAAIAAVAVTWQPGIRVVDGDTVDHGWWRWRLAGLDAAETGSRARCLQERAAGAAAKDRLGSPLQTGRLFSCHWSRYVSATAMAAVGPASLSTVAAVAMIADGHARPYAGGHRANWYTVI